jgi:hypothetical protein
MRATKLHQFSRGSEIGSIRYDPERLSVEINPGALVSFLDAVGFRVLDEGDLLEFWPACSAASGSGVFEIDEGGWLAQERAREGFISATRPNMREFLVTSPDDCVSVFAFDAPQITDAAL